MERLVKGHETLSRRDWEVLVRGLSSRVGLTSSTGGREEQVRRLITLISAGRNRTIVIRRELPRTTDASSGARPYRIKGRRVLLAVSPSPATGAAAKRYKSLFSGGLPLRLWFGFDGDGPGEAQQFPGNGRHDLWFVFAGRCEFLVAGTQAPLRLQAISLISCSRPC